ncbi:molybdenum cofactor biosynthesis protein MoaE [Bauldia litoralis]|uniref:Molybdopterin synthase catalytic subunit n=1 Tax=Bauldia litoralis TaxID=665467 RepID=A0A1G6DHA9_9HYPH|nr:molybdenum cofactor biosynthesis protein MoaE [Bauldia litoralis]SDB44520.1 molybdopterin synthase catalytic subunit [Bauldia litoralis]
MADRPPIDVRVQAADFDVAAESERLARLSRNVGAIVTFTGLCRDEDGKLAALELEHYPGMAEAEIARIAGEAADRWPLLGLTVIHRYGRIHPGENIVLVVAASSHREAAFAAADFLMDFLKTRAPFWKKEHVAGAEAPSEWVSAKENDDQTVKRWSSSD